MERGCKYTDEELLSQVQMLAEELGRTPKKLEFDIDDRTASVATCAQRFGSWKNFLEQAGLVPRQPYRLPNEKIVEQVLLMAYELGRVPTEKEFGDNPRTTTLEMCRERFGDYDGLLIEAGLKI